MSLVQLQRCCAEFITLRGAKFSDVGVILKLKIFRPLLNPIRRNREKRAIFSTPKMAQNEFFQNFQNFEMKNSVIINAI